MRYASLSDFLTRGRRALAKGPVAVIVIEDLAEVVSTITHHQRLGFRAIVVLAPDALALPDDIAATIHHVRYHVTAPDALQQAVNVISAAAPGIWFYYGYNAEYLFYPFCETRSIGEMLAFHTEERRDAMLCYVIDLYAGDLAQYPDAVSLNDAHIDRQGYYAQARKDAQGNLLERQLDFSGGLRWRFEEHIPPARRKIDRIALFRARKGLELRENHTFNVEEYNTYACPWHHNLTAAVASFRTAKALKSNAGSAFDIPTFLWQNSVRFDWQSRQLLDLGLMEPGQWF